MNDLVTEQKGLRLNHHLLRNGTDPKEWEELRFTGNSCHGTGFAESRRAPAPFAPACRGGSGELKVLLFKIWTCPNLEHYAVSQARRIQLISADLM